METKETSFEKGGNVGGITKILPKYHRPLNKT